MVETTSEDAVNCERQMLLRRRFGMMMLYHEECKSKYRANISEEVGLWD